jgi:hypothetical protein
MSDCSRRCFVPAGCGMFSALLLYWVVRHASCCHYRKLEYRMAGSGSGSCLDTSHDTAVFVWVGGCPCDRHALQLPSCLS